MTQKQICLFVTSTALAFVLGLGIGAVLLRDRPADLQTRISHLTTQLELLQDKHKATLILAEEKKLPHKQPLSEKKQTAQSTVSVTSAAPSRKLIDQTKLQKELAYLWEIIPEVRWCEIEGNDVFIGFDPLPDDWKAIIAGAALRGNKAINLGCNVWAVRAQHKGWRPGAGPYYGEITARYGRIED